MFEDDAAFLACPSCRANLILRDPRRADDGRVDTGILLCAGCSKTYPIIRSIPRFVPAENYAASFGLQWRRHARTQYDSESGLDLSARRFRETTAWPARLEGQRILEAGCGAGRFTEQALKTGAAIVSLDFSTAIDVAFELNGRNRRHLAVQADLMSPPFRTGSFDRIFCLGVLQHTPDPARAFASLTPLLGPGGSIAVDVYRASMTGSLLHPKYWVRPLTRRANPERLYRLVTAWIDLMWPITRIIAAIPRFGYRFNWRLLVADHSHLGLSPDALKEWAYLDTYDMLAPRYDFPQRIETVRDWFEKAGIHDASIRFGWNGIEGRGRKDGVT